MLLIVTNREDYTADWLVAELWRRKAPFIRFNTEDYPSGTSLDWRISDSSTIEVGSTVISSSEISAVWYRRPVPPALFNEDGHRRLWAEREARDALDGFWRTLDAVWVNHPDANLRSSSKQFQLKLAASLGFAIPGTVVTNDPTVARDFCRSHDGHTIVKPLRSGRIMVDGEPHLFFTSRVSDSLKDIPFDRLGEEPYIFQREIPKAADIRVTVIGDRAFAVRILSQTMSDSETDFRRVDPATIPHVPFDLPEEIEARCVALVRHSECSFGAIDLIQTLDGSFFFLENNPNGQWAWIEQLTSIPLRSHLADLLLAT